jgi:hypothetical protein
MVILSAETAKHFRLIIASRFAAPVLDRPFLRIPSLKDFPVVHQKGVSLPASVDFEKRIVFFQSVYFHVDKSYQPPTYPPRSVEDVLTTFFSRPSSR